MKRFPMMVFVTLFAMAAAACGAAPVDQCLKASNPAECKQVVSAGGNASDYLTYGMAGYMLGSVMNGGQRQTVIVSDPAYRGYRRPIASYDASKVPIGQRLHSVTTTTRTSRSGGMVTTTTRTRSWSSGRSFGRRK